MLWRFLSQRYCCYWYYYCYDYYNSSNYYFSYHCVCNTHMFFLYCCQNYNSNYRLC